MLLCFSLLWSGEELRWRAKPTCKEQLLMFISFYRYLGFFFSDQEFTESAGLQRPIGINGRRLYLFVCLFLDLWCARSLRLLLRRRGSRCKQAVMGEIWCFESVVLFFETFETCQSKPKLAIFPSHIRKLATSNSRNKKERNSSIVINLAHKSVRWNYWFQFVPPLGKRDKFSPPI